jgi:hypothetical protein
MNLQSVRVKTSSVIARGILPEAISSTARGLLRRGERPARNDEFTYIGIVENMKQTLVTCGSLAETVK